MKFITKNIFFMRARRLTSGWPVQVVLCLLVLYGPSVQAETACEKPQLGRPKVGLVLGGGGARGSAHIGVIRVLEELNIPVDYVTGTSIGSLVGAMYATGMSADELEAVILSIDWDELFDDDTAREERPFRRKRDDDLALFGPKLGIGADSSLLPTGAISGQKVNYLFESLVKQRTQSRDFAALPIPYRAIATDLVTGDEVVLKQGDLALAMRASMSVPGLFNPVAWGQYMLVDGGLVNNVPIDVVREMGADIVIAIDVGSGLTPRDELDTMVSVVAQLANFMTKTNSDRSLATLGEDDVLIRPPLGDIVTSAGFAKAAQGIEIGYAAADLRRDDLRHLGVPSQDYTRWRAALQKCVTAPPKIQFVRLDNHSRFDDSVILERVTVREGDNLDVEAIKSDISDIYALGFLELVRYMVVEEDGETGVVFHIEQDTRGTQFIETGLDYSGGDDDSSVNLRLGYLNSAVDPFGSELRVLTQLGENPAVMGELYKYIEPRLKLVVKPRLFAERRELTQYDDKGNALTISEVEQYGGSVGLGREFGRHATIFGGIRLFTGTVEIDTGPPETDDYDYDGGEYFLGGTYDRLDDRYFPGSGSMISFNYYNSRDELGADEEFEQIVLDAISAHTFSRHTLMGGVRYYETVDGNAPDYALFRAGGFARLSGFQAEERAGQNFGMLLAGYRYHFAGSGLLPAYLGATLEYGQVAEDSDDIFDDGLVHGSVYFGYRSPIGPVYLGVGAGEDGDETIFLRIGNIFGNSSIAR